jgi:hypothetical protein
MNAEEEVLAKLDRLGALLFARDPAVVGELWCDLGFTLYGSEEGETVETLAELERLFQALFARQYRLAWKWDRRRATCQESIAWIAAEGRIEMTHPDRVEHLPYRMIGILQRIGGAWRWRLFSGSEPASAR